MSDLGNPKIIQELIREKKFTVQKKYGQNFLVDDNILQGIVNAAEVTKDDLVLEIGPGMGSLTQYLLEAAGHVIAVEVDRMLIPILQENLKDYDNLTLIHGDVLKLDLNEIIKEVSKSPDTKVKVVANLPYYITTPIVMELLEKQDNIESITVMVQKEVAQRMQEGPGSKSYGALSLAVQYYAKPEIVLRVSKNCFLPKPDVDSAVIRLTIYPPEERPVQTEDPKGMFRLIRAAFNQRRKTLVNALSNDAAVRIPKEKTAKALAALGLPESVRGEALTLLQFAQLSDLLFGRTSVKTKILPVTDENISAAGGVLQNGGICAFPTDTVYGLGAVFSDDAAVAKLFEAKERDEGKPLSILVSSAEEVSLLAEEIPEKAKALMKQFWPGALTIVLKKSPSVSDKISAGKDTVGIRMPDHPVTLALLKAAGSPLAAPSANLSGKRSSVTAEEVREDLEGRIDILLDGGACPVGVSSTVVDLTGEKPLILREGSVTKTMIDEA